MQERKKTEKAREGHARDIVRQRRQNREVGAQAGAQLVWGGGGGVSYQSSEWMKHRIWFSCFQ